MSLVTTKSKNKVKNKVLPSNIFAKILYKITFNKKKGNRFLVSMDLLKEDVKKNLLYTTTLIVEETYINLIEQTNYLSPNFIKRKGKSLLLLVIKKTSEAFLTKEYGYPVHVQLQCLKQSLYTKKLLEDNEILFQVPLYALLDQNSLKFRSIYAPIYNYACEDFLEVMIDNLILEISNCVTYFSLTNFSYIYACRQTLYKSKFLSLRNFERFKNNLTWQLRIKMYIQRPNDLYNNRYEIGIFRTSGVYYKILYANRSRELGYLTEFSLVVLVFIETLDFLTSRLDEVFYIVSNALRFTFTSVLGQLLGLVWRGIIEGLKKES